MTQLTKRLDDLEAGIKDKRARDDKAKFIVIQRLDGWIVTHDLTTGEITRASNQDEQIQQTT